MSALLTPTDRYTLERWLRAPTTPQRTALRSRIVLLLADGFSAREVARRLGVSRHTVDLWRKRYSREGYEALTHDRPGRGRNRAAGYHLSARSGISSMQVTTRELDDCGIDLATTCQPVDVVHGF